MLRLALAFTTALVFHLFLLWLPLPDHSKSPSHPASREVSIDLTSEPRSSEAEDKPEPTKDTPEPGKKEKDRKQPVERLKPTHLKKKIVSRSRETEAPTSESAAASTPKQEKKSSQPSHKKAPQPKSSDKAARKTNSADDRKDPPEKESRPVVEKASPLYRENPPPSYPVIAKRRGWEGRVILEVEVNRNGTVKDAAVQKSSGYAVLDKAALKAVRNWRFSPGTHNGGTVAMTVKIPVNFQIQ